MLSMFEREELGEMPGSFLGIEALNLGSCTLRAFTNSENGRVWI